jgi:hypothetical protein
MNKLKQSIFWSKKRIIKYIKTIPDSYITSCFNLVYHGTNTAGNNKRPTTISIIIPKQIAKNNLKFTSNWNFLLIGIGEK